MGRAPLNPVLLWEGEMKDESPAVNSRSGNDGMREKLRILACVTPWNKLLHPVFSLMSPIDYIEKSLL